ncbi:MAG TPA: hypothetical protein VHM19_06915, partial [Polyangiales bacterium]|nr:hypothetical protein [Polyangiales bacterium]
MQRPNTKTRLAISWLCLALAACSSDKHHSVLVITGMDDDGGAADGGEKDGAAPDAGADHTLVSMGTTLCAYDDADRYEAGREARADVLSAAASQAGFGLLYQRSDGALFVQATGLSGKPESAHALVAASEHASSPLLVANDKDFAVVYRSSSAS